MGKKKVKTVRPGGMRARERTAAEVEFLQRLGAKIKKLRVAGGWSAAELAAAIGISRNSQYYRESGSQAGQWEDLYRYAVVLKCNPSDLLP